MLNPDPKQAREFGYYFALSQAGLEMIVPMLFGLWVDYLMGWGPWGLIIGVILGFVGGTFHLIVMANRIESRRKQQQQDDTRP